MNDEQRLGAPVGLPPGVEHDISIMDLVSPIWRRLWVVGLVALLFVGGAVGFTLTRTPVYEANIMILIGKAQVDEAPANLLGEVEGLQELTETLVEAVDTRPVAEATIQKLDLSMPPAELLGNLEAEQVAATQFIAVSYRDPDPDRAQRIVNTVGESFSGRISEVNPSGGITATIWERATVPQTPISPNLIRNLLLALVAGVTLGVALAYLLEYMDDSWRSPEEAEQISGVPTFGVIPAFKASKVR